MALQLTPNPRANGNLSLTANMRARMSSVLSIGWDYVTGKPDFATTYQPLDSDLTALAANSTDGFWAHTAAGTGAARTLAAPAAGLTISNPAGIAGNPTFALANDLAALEGLSSNGMIARTATDTAAVRTITGTTNHITVTNGDGVSGNPTILRPATPSFEVHKNAVDQTGIADVTFTDITWSTEASDIGSYFASDVWTPPAGVVYVVCQVAVFGTFPAGAVMALRITRSGSSIAQGNWYAPVSNAATALICVTSTASGSETFKAQIYMDVSSGTGTISGTAVNSYFRGAWLGPSS